MLGDPRLGRKQGGQAADRRGREPGRALGLDELFEGDDLPVACFGQDHAQHPLLIHPLDRGSGVGDREQVLQFPADPLAAEALERGRELGAGALRFFVELGAEARLEAIVAQDAQVILADARVRIADEAHAAFFEVGQAVEEIEQFQRDGVGVERVDREIAPGGVLAPVAGESDRCAPAIGRDILAQRGDFHWSARENGGDGAVSNPRRHTADPRLIKPGDHFVRLERRGGVDILDRLPEQGVAHRAADPAQVFAPERSDQARQVLALRPLGLGKLSHRPIPATPAAARGCG